MLVPGGGWSSYNPIDGAELAVFMAECLLDAHKCVNEEVGCAVLGLWLSVCVGGGSGGGVADGRYTAWKAGVMLLHAAGSTGEGMGSGNTFQMRRPSVLRQAQHPHPHPPLPLPVPSYASTESAAPRC